MISRGIAQGIAQGASEVGVTLGADSGPAAAQARQVGEAAKGSLTQNIYLRDEDSSPYRTARRIRRESEAMFR